jgi:hypothetical protein
VLYVSRLSAIFSMNVQKFTAIAAAVSEEHSCSAAICRRKCTIYTGRLLPF